jgi:hypothetical protein
VDAPDLRLRLYRQTLGVIGRPLVAVDGSVTNAEYQNHGATPATFEHFKVLRDICRHYDDELTLLSHNNQLVELPEMTLYSALIVA